MPLTDPTPDGATLDECLDELNDFVGTLERFPPVVLALAMRIHMESLLRALLERGMCTRAEVREFLRQLEQEALQLEDS